LFEKGYCRALIELGYQDAMNRKKEIQAFLNSEQETKWPDTSAANNNLSQ
jgi:hypothetical protein